MPNRSKIRDPKAWKKWADAGALGRLHTLPRPFDINTSDHFWDAFGLMEKETSARWIVRLCQSLGSWRSFTEQELQQFYEAGGRNEKFWFNGLDNEGFVVRGRDGRYKVTERFVLACFKSSPMT